MTVQQEVCVKVKHRMESLSVHFSVSILSSIFYDICLAICENLNLTTKVSVIPQYNPDRNTCTFRTSLGSTFVFGIDRCLV